MKATLMSKSTSVHHAAEYMPQNSRCVNC